MTGERPAMTRHLTPPPQRSCRYLKTIASSAYIRALFSAGLVDTLTNFSNRSVQAGLASGYSDGTRDHYVLSTLGIRWAEPLQNTILRRVE